VLKQQRFFSLRTFAREEKILVKNTGVRKYTIFIQTKHILLLHAMSRVATIIRVKAFAVTDMVSLYYLPLNAVIKT
jgi:hypothetical protein